MPYCLKPTNEKVACWGILLHLHTCNIIVYLSRTHYPNKDLVSSYFVTTIILYNKVNNHFYSLSWMILSSKPRLPIAIVRSFCIRGMTCICFFSPYTLATNKVKLIIFLVPECLVYCHRDAWHAHYCVFLLWNKELYDSYISTCIILGNFSCIDYHVKFMHVVT